MLLARPVGPAQVKGEEEISSPFSGIHPSPMQSRAQGHEEAHDGLAILSPATEQVGTHEERECQPEHPPGVSDG